MEEVKNEKQEGGGYGEIILGLVAAAGLLYWVFKDEKPKEQEAPKSNETSPPVSK